MSEDKGGKYEFQTAEGHKFSGVNKKLHSFDDQPSVIYNDGTKWWYRDGKIHREKGPAVINSNGVEEWWSDNKRHRDDGPAVTYPDDIRISPEMRGVKQFWNNGILVREELPPAIAAYRADLIALRKRHGLS